MMTTNLQYAIIFFTFCWLLNVRITILQAAASSQRNIIHNDDDGDSYIPPPKNVDGADNKLVVEANEKNSMVIDENAGTTNNIKSLASNSIQADGASTDEDKTPQFGNPLYIAQMEKKAVIKDSIIPVDISLLHKDKVPTLTIEDAISGQGFSTNLAVVEKEAKIVLSVAKDVAEDALSKISQLIFILKAVTDGQHPCHTIIILNLINPKEIVFEQPEYRVEVLAEQRGIVGQYQAILKNKDGAAVKYKLLLNEAKLSDSLKIDENKGTLSVVGALNVVGTIDLKIEASVEGDETLKTETQVHLVVSHTTLCGTDNAIFSYALLTKHIPEEQVVENILPASTVYPNCQYAIASQSPNGDYFSLDTTHGSLSLTKAVDRESSIFSGMKVPSFTLEIELSCNKQQQQQEAAPSQTRRLKKTDKSDDEQQPKKTQQPTTVPLLDAVSEIKYNPKKMTLRIVVDDINDHPPIFPEKNLIIGYPSLFSFIRHYPPSSLTTVQATDKDAGENAKIQYSIDEGRSCPFSIHPSSGAIYPWKYHDSTDDVVFTVVAKNADDKSDKKQSRMSVTVKFLLQPQISEFIYEHALMEDVTRVLKEASIAGKCHVKALSSAVIPYNAKVHDTKKLISDNNGNDKAEDIPHLLRMLVYGISDDHASRVIDGSELSRNLKQLQYTLDAQPIPQETLVLIRGREYSIFSLVLILIGITLIVGLIVSHMLYVKNHAKNKDGNSRIPLNEDAEPISHTHWMNSQFSVFNGATDTSTRIESTTTNHQGNSTRPEENPIRLEKLNGDDIILLDSRNCRYLKACTVQEPYKNSSVSTFKPAPDSMDEQQNRTTSNNQQQQVNVATIPVTDYTIVVPRPDVSLRHRQQSIGDEQHPTTIATNPFPILPKPPHPEKHAKKVIKP